MQKMNFIIHFFLTILHFKECSNLIGWQHLGSITEDPKLLQIYWWNINNNIYSFHFRLFTRKPNMTKFFKISKKYPILVPFCAFFAQILAKMNFPGKRALSVFQYLYYLPLCQNLEKPNEPFLRKLLGRHTKNQFVPLISSWDTESCHWLKNPSIWLPKSILGHISGTWIFPNMKFVQVYKNYSNIYFHYRPN